MRIKEKKTRLTLRNMIMMMKGSFTLSLLKAAALNFFCCVTASVLVVGVVT